MGEKATSMPHKDVAVVIMAAGKGTRMKNPNLAKVMYELNGRPMIHYAVDLAYALQAGRVIVIVGYQREVVERYIRQSHPDAECAVQERQLGTGHAVMQSEKLLQSFAGDVLVLSGDVPLLTKATMERLLRCHRESHAIATILTAEMDDPAGYGRIVRNEDQSVKKIVEHKDAQPNELALREINSGIYAFEKGMLFEGLSHITPHNVQNEFYLTDVFEYFWKKHGKVSALKAPHLDEVRGINTIEQLEEAKGILESRKSG